MPVLPVKHLTVQFRLFLLPLLLFFACERATDLRVEGNGFVVVECVLTQEERQTMRLTLTEQGTAGGYERLQKARICVYDETAGSIAGSFSYVGEDKWESVFSGQPEHTYRLEIEAEGYGLVTARTTMPEKPHIQCLYHLYHYRSSIADGFGYYVDIQGRSHGNDAIKIEDAVPEFESAMRFVTSSLPEGPVWIVGGDERPEGISDNASEIIATSILNADPFNLTGEVFYDERSEACAQGRFPEIPGIEFSPYGWFYYVQGQPVHERYIRIPSIREAGPRETREPDGFFSVFGRFSYDTPLPPSFLTVEEYFRNYGSTQPYDISAKAKFKTVIFLSPSEEYDQYLKALLIEEQDQRLHTDEYSSLFRRRNVYSNVENGTGVFGAYTQVLALTGLTNIWDGWLYQPEITHDL